MRWPSVAAAILSFAIATSLAPGALAGPAEEAAFEEATATVLCDCGCHPQSVHACACGRAAEMRAEMREMADAGMDGEAIVDHYVGIHGEKIRIAPEARGFNLVAWLLPLFALVVAAAAMVALIRHWRRRSAVEEERDAPPGGAPRSADPADAAYLERLERAVRDAE